MAKFDSRTRHKLAEAQFFLDQLKLNHGKLKKFDYFLSAFISSARSVFWVMKSEYKHVSGWEAWHKITHPTQEEDALLKGTNAIRIRTEKHGSLKTAPTFAIQVRKEDEERFRESLSKSKGRKVSLKLSGTNKDCVVEMNIDGEQIVFPATEVRMDRKLDEFPDRSILEVCQRYYDTIARIVDECGRKFDAQ